jgi:3-oxoacyl-[acyl-carrier-protein] synthase III
MMMQAVTTALTQTHISPQYVTHFVPHSSTSGEPYRSVAKAVDLPWAESLHQNDLDHGYLGVSTEVTGLVHLAESGSLHADSIVLLLAAEYQLSATAVLLRIIEPPVVSIDGVIRIAA